MVPIVTPDEMRAIDRAAPLSHDELVERAGTAVARAAVRMLGGTYGRVVAVIEGAGSNGADGRVAARRLRESGVMVREFDALTCPPSLVHALPSPLDLVVDAAFGTGFRGTWQPPDTGAVPVLAVDLPSGVDALTGNVAGGGSALRATRTVTFAALKPGLLFGTGRVLSGDVEVVDADEMGLAAGVHSTARAHLVERSDVATWLPQRAVDAHKWRHAVRVVAGSSGMEGAARLVCSAALRSGSGMVHLTSPDGVLRGLPVEVVQVPVGSSAGVPATVVESLSRFGALVIGPGLGRDDATVATVHTLVAQSAVPVVVDGDGLFALAHGPNPVARRADVLATPHDGEFTVLAGSPPGDDRLGAARALATRLGVTVLLKGPVTVVAAPDGAALVVDEGDERLATAGSGDVLAGIAGALLAQGLGPLVAGATAAWLHGRAGRWVSPHGMIASDLVGVLPAVWSDVTGEVR
ncbi:MAG: NAD(P)H-hydrate dehydratase [Ilumatobacteraceae bacterium]